MGIIQFLNVRVKNEERQYSQSPKWAQFQYLQQSD